MVRTKIGKVFGVNGGGSAGLDFLPCQRKEQTEYRSTLGSLELGVGCRELLQLATGGGGAEKRAQSGLRRRCCVMIEWRLEPKRGEVVVWTVGLGTRCATIVADSSETVRGITRRTRRSVRNSTGSEGVVILRKNYKAPRQG